MSGPGRRSARASGARTLLLLAGFLLLLGGGAWQVLRRDAGRRPSGLRGHGFPAYLYYQLDTNADRLLDREEFGLDDELRATFDRVDANHDGIASVEELRVHYQERELPAVLAGIYEPPLEELREVAGERVTDPRAWNNAPALAVTADGATWVAWVRHTMEGEGGSADEVVLQKRTAPASVELRVLSPEPGQYVRPALVPDGGGVACVWTRSAPDAPASVWVWRAGSARRLAPEEARAHQNPELATGPEGTLAVAYQVHDGARYAIHLRIARGDGWSEPLSLSAPDTNDWDPTLVYDDQGRLHVAWSSYRDGDYDVVHVRLDDPGARAAPAPRRLSARGPYDLHPWLARGRDGAVWLAWDEVEVRNHQSSGKTTITGANLRDVQPGSNFQRGAARLAVRVLDGETLRDASPPEAGPVPGAPGGYLLSHSALPRVVLGAGGEPWILFRALRAGENPWDPRDGIGFHWDLLGQVLRDGAWQPAVRFDGSDGFLEEPGAIAAGDGLRVVYGGERRAGSVERARARRADGNHHRDFDGRAGCNGDVYLAELAGAAGPGPDLAALPAARLDDRPVVPRPRRPAYEVDHGGATYRLLWGDTHKHSNVSRCSRGMEPAPEDQYRYGVDLGRFDYFALSDHAEHFRLTAEDRGAYYAWLQTKLADLYHVPGHLSVLYNLEWTLRFPHGHHNVIFAERSPVLLARNMAESNTLQKGYDVLEASGVRAITIPHTGASPEMGTTWEVHDPRFERLCEVFQSATGSYEHEGCPRQFHNSENSRGFYWEALERGYHVGAIASSDHGFDQAYACVYATENTREAVWQALYDRRAYGSTTYGLVLDVRSGAHWMGEVWSAAEAPVLSIKVEGAAPLRSVEVLGRSSVLWAAGSASEPLGTTTFATEWSDPDWESQTAEQWYYVRVIQEDDEIAWSSPVWVTPTAR